MVYNTITEQDYKLVENPNEDFYGVQLTSGNFKDVLIIYGAVSVKELDDGTAKLSFNYNLKDPADHDYDTLVKDEVFNNYLGDVLQHIISDSLENKEARIGNKTSTTDTHTESPTD